MKRSFCRPFPVCAAVFIALTMLAPLLPGPSPAFAAAPPKKAAAKKTKKTVVKKAARRKKPTRLVVKPLPKPVVKIAPKVIVPAPKVVPTPVIPVPRPVPVPVPAPLPIAKTPTPAQMNVPVSLGDGTLTLVQSETTDKALPNLFGPNPPDQGTHYVVYTIRVKNDTQNPLSVSLDSLNPQLRIAGREQPPLRGIALLTAKNDKFEQQPIKPGEEKMLRFHFQVPLTAAPRSLTLGASTGTTYEFDVSGGQH